MAKFAKGIKKAFKKVSRAVKTGKALYKDAKSLYKTYVPKAIRSEIRTATAPYVQPIKAGLGIAKQAYREGKSIYKDARSTHQAFKQARRNPSEANIDKFMSRGQKTIGRAQRLPLTDYTLQQIHKRVNTR